MSVLLNKLLVATHNEGKRKEFAKLLEPYVAEVLSAAQLNLPEPEETENTFEGNARLKAMAGMKASGLLTLADDSGFGIEALNGRPGVFSARFAISGDDHDYDHAAQRLHEELAGGVRHAYFMCALVLAHPNGATHLVAGRCDGEFVYPRRGNKGFGYDAFFVPEGHGRSFGEMDPEEKLPISHRGKALENLTRFLASAEGRAFLTGTAPGL